ncbi:MAG: hypothetical protein IH611_12765 [Deltaproteobacteria bacterium]|nr:hypothetical protein [Deltaproteobacteria bacterium]
MRIGKTMLILGAAATLSFIISFLPAGAYAGGGRMIRLAEMDMGDGGGTAVNLTVQKVAVQPIRAHVGDVIDVEVWIDNREDGSETSWAEVYANKKVVAREMFRWGTPGADHTYKLHLRWDTSGMAPGAYKVKAEVFVFNDASPFDNELAMKEPVVLVAPGGEFPGGMQAGGSATEIDESYR